MQKYSQNRKFEDIIYSLLKTKLAYNFNVREDFLTLNQKNANWGLIFAILSIV